MISVLGERHERPLRRRRRGLRFAILGLVLLAGLQAIWWTEPIALFGLLQWATPGLLWYVPTTRPLVALSFDDGPHPTHTREVLAILARHEAHATFFLIGQRATAHPDVVQAIRAGGHELGNHYARGGTSLGDDPATFAANLAYAEQAIGLAGSPKLFRPPGGLAWPWQLQQARALGYTCVLGCAYPHDPAHPPRAYIAWLVVKNLVPGAIVILHDGISDPSRSLQALPEILAEGQERGIRFVTVGELLREGRRMAPAAR